MQKRKRPECPAGLLFQMIFRPDSYDPPFLTSRYAGQRPHGFAACRRFHLVRFAHSMFAVAKVAHLHAGMHVPLWLVAYTKRQRDLSHCLIALLLSESRSRKSSNPEHAAGRYRAHGMLPADNPEHAAGRYQAQGGLTRSDLTRCALLPRWHRLRWPRRGHPDPSHS